MIVAIDVPVADVLILIFKYRKNIIYDNNLWFILHLYHMENKETVRSD